MDPSELEEESIVLSKGDGSHDDSLNIPSLDLKRLLARRTAHQVDYSRTARKSNGRIIIGSYTCTPATEAQESSIASVRASRQALHARLIKQLDQEEDVLNANFQGCGRQLRYFGKGVTGRKETQNERDKRQVIRRDRVEVRSISPTTVLPVKCELTLEPSRQAAEERRKARYRCWTSQVDSRNIILGGNVDASNPLRPLDLVVFVAGPKTGRNKQGRTSIGIGQQGVHARLQIADIVVSPCIDFPKS